MVEYLGKFDTGKSYKKYAVILVIGALGLLGLGVHLALAKATITVVPKQEAISVTFQVPVSQSTVGDTSFGMAGTFFDETQQKTVDVTDVANKTINTQATGTVTLFNQQPQSQPFLKDTQLLADNGQVFRLKKHEDVPAGGQTDAEVYADQPGAAGEVEPTHFIVKLLPYLKDKLYAQSTAKFTGGTKQAQAVDDTDIKAAQDKAVQQIVGDITSSLQSSNPKLVVIANSLTTDVQQATASVASGTETDHFSMTVKAHVIGMAFAESDLRQIAEEQLKGKVPLDQELTVVDANSFTYSIDSFDQKAKSLLLKVTLAGTVVHKVTASDFSAHELAGRTIDEAKSYILGKAGVESTTVQLSPFWVKAVPNNESRIFVTVK